MLDAGAALIGVNNRDLHTFRVDLEHTIRMRRQMPDDRVLVAESGIHTRDDVLRLQAAGGRCDARLRKSDGQRRHGRRRSQLVGRVALPAPPVNRLTTGANRLDFKHAS